MARRVVPGLFVAFVAAVLVCASARAGGKNLEYFSSNLSPEDLKAEMKKLQRSVGAQSCEYCHVVKPKRDFALDSVPNKKTTRSMLKMVDKIQKELFTKDALGIKEGEAPTATCLMCHHEKAKPVLKPEGADQEKARTAFDEEVKKPEHAAMLAGMKKMLESLNKNVFTWKDAPQATCWMCHRGTVKLETKLPDE